MEKDKSETIKQNPLGTDPIGKLLLTMSAPMMFSMLVLALYNVVDSIYIGKVSENALTALSLIFPIQVIMSSIAIGTCVGVSSLVSRSLGQRDTKKAEDTAYNALLIVIFYIALFIVLAFTFTRPFLSMFTSDAEILDDAIIYAKIVMGVNFGLFFETMCSRIVQGTGDSFHPMLVQCIGAVTNIILDPFFIYGWAGLPAMGVAGAAWATVIGQILAAFFAFLWLKKNKYITFSFRKFAKFHPSGSIIREIYQVGLPSILMQSITAVTTSFMNMLLISFSSTATAVYGIFFKLQSFVFMPVFGMNSGLISIIGYNFGAKNTKRIKQALFLGIKIGFLIMSLGFIVFQLFSPQLLSIFSASDSMIAMGTTALKRLSLAFVPASISILMCALFNGTGKGFYALILSMTRQLVFLIPSAWILGKLVGLEGIWYCNIIAELVSLILSLYLYKKMQKVIEFPEAGVNG